MAPGTFSIGDGHYSQSEGEVCGVVVEGSMHTTLAVDVIKGFYCDWPRFEDEDFIMTAGSFRPLEDAFRIAHTQLVHWLVADVGLSLPGLRTHHARSAAGASGDRAASGGW